jgi:ABC-type ATPase involved in cell division
VITRIELENFTAFPKLRLNPSSGINVFIGANGTGKTHLLKVAYAACAVAKTKESYADKLLRVFLPHQRQLGRLAHRQVGSIWASAGVVRRDGAELRVRFSNHAETAASASVQGARRWSAVPIECAYIPVKEMLANAPGFRSLYAEREIHFEEVYADIVDRAYRPLPKGPPSDERRRFMERIRKAIEGRVTMKKEEFFLRSKQGNLELTLVAEGVRKLALLSLLLQNGTLLSGSVLFWDEPEANLNPNLMRVVVEVLLELQRMGVQVFIATHDYVTLKEFDLQTAPDDHVAYHALWRGEEDGTVRLSTTEDYVAIQPNAIADTFMDLYDRDVRRALSGGGTG